MDKEIEHAVDTEREAERGMVVVLECVTDSEPVEDKDCPRVDDSVMLCVEERVLLPLTVTCNVPFVSEPDGDHVGDGECVVDGKSVSE